MKKRLAIFDMDETLISSDFAWALAPIRFLERMEIDSDPSLKNDFYEYGISKVIGILKSRYKIDLPDKEIFEALTEETLYDYRYNVTLKEFASETVDIFRDAGFFTCVLSANSPIVLDIVKNRFSDELKMDGWFSTKNMPYTKEDERAFDLIASYFGVNVSDCVLLDDAEYALSTAERLGVPFVRIENNHGYNGCAQDKKAYPSLKAALPLIKEIISR